MSEVVKEIHDLDRDFSEIEVNGEVFESENYVAPLSSPPLQVNDPSENNPEPPASEPIQGQSVRELELNGYIHDLEDSNTKNDLTELAEKVTDLENLVPAQASTSNQLADKSFVNSTVQTGTANFRGNWGTWSDVPSDSSLYPVDYAGSKVPTVNDYMVVQNASDYSVENEGTWRFKYSGLWSVDGKNGWHPEYQVNETPFSASQLASINSGITAEKVSMIPESAVAEIDDNTTSNSKVWSSTKTNSMIDAMFDICHPVGELYVQLPDMSDPNTLYGRGTWTEISSDYAGLFFRVVGGNASAFGTNQAEGLPNITGSWWGVGGKNSSDYSGAFSGTSPSSNKGTSGSSGAFGGTIRFGANYSNSIYGSSSHVTPVNTAIKLWKRTA